MNLNWLYTAVTRILLFWHDYVWSFLEGTEVLGTNWDWVLAIVCLVITVRVILFPLFVKQIKAQRKMQVLQPRMKELQQQYKGDNETLRQEMSKLYREEKANPLMGCLPMFLQIPVFISLFWILGRRMNPNRPDFVEGQWAAAEAGEPISPRVLEHMPPELRAQAEAGTSDPSIVERIKDFILEWSHIELYGWTIPTYTDAANAKLFNAPIAAVFYETTWFERDLAAHYPEMGTSQLNVSIVAGTLALVMVVTTFLTTRQMILKTGWATDPNQLMMQRLMVYGIPAMLLFSGAFFPISVIIYWVINNLFSLGQQQWVLRKYPPPQNAATAASGKGPAGGKGAAKAGEEDTERPAVDGKKLAPKPGAKPVPPKKAPAKAAKAAKATPQKAAAKANAKKVDTKNVDAANVPPKRVPSASIPPKRKGGSGPSTQASSRRRKD